MLAFIKRLIAALGLLAIVMAVYLFVARPYQLHWGATEAEKSAPMPGDELDATPDFFATRAITINGTPQEIWPWLIQMGYNRAGFYGYDLLENLGSERGMLSAEHILPEFQNFQVGDVVPISAVAEMEFYAIEPEQYLIWGGIDDTSRLIWALQPTDDTHTRLISRFRWSYDLSKPQELPLQLLTEFTDHLAVRKILMGVKGRVEGDVEPIAVQNTEFVLFLISAFTFVAALILLLVRPLDRGQWFVGLVAGLAWLTIWYAPIHLWLGIVISLLAIFLLLYVTTLRSRQLRQGMETYHPFKSQKAKERYLAFYDKYAEQWPVASENLMVDTSFGQTFVRVSGPSDGQPLVLLPGDSVNSLAWIPQIEAFSAKYRIYALDHVFDNGRSIYSRPMKKPADFVAWLDELFTALELESINLVAHSYGAWQASLYALAHPQRLNRLVLLTPAATVLPPSLGVLVRGILYFFFPTPAILRRYLYWNYPDATRKSEATRAVIDTMVTEALLSKRCFKPRNFVAPTTLTDDEWQNLSVPTLFITAENEVFYPAQKALRRLQSVAPHVKTLFTRDAGHDVAIVKPEWVNNEVLKFLTNQKDGKGCNDPQNLVG